MIPRIMMLYSESRILGNLILKAAGGDTGLIVHLVINFVICLNDDLRNTSRK